jgi:hypothetical protein
VFYITAESFKPGAARFGRQFDGDETIQALVAGLVPGLDEMC